MADSKWMCPATCFFFLSLSLIWTVSIIPQVSSEGTQCGRPDRPVNGTTSPTGKIYFPGEKVTYSCLEGFVLFGEETRTCLKNATWSGDVPLCDFNLARGKRTLQSDTLWSYKPDLAVDGNVDTCSFTPKGPDPRWWQVHLGHKFNVVAIGVTISPGSIQEFTIFVIELLADNKALYKPCTTFKGVFQTHKGLFKCNDGLGHPGQFVYIRDDRQKEEYFGLCEVEVFAFRERIPCGDPEVPANGEMNREGEDRVIYTCNTGTKLEGDSVLTCSSKGRWQGQVPKCVEVRCSAPKHVENGYIEIGSPRGEYVYDTEAKYGCSPGYILRGSAVRKCEHNGTWSGDAPSCQGVTCGDPPNFANARYTLLNDSSQWTGIAVYSCNDGFKLKSDHDDTVTTCLDAGVWRAVNVTCVEAFSANLIERQLQGRSLELEYPLHKKDESNPYLVITLAVVACLLAAGMIVFGVLLVRKRLLSGPGSLSPLVRCSDKSSPYDSRQGNVTDPSNELPPPYITCLGKPNQYQTNLLQSLAAHRDYRNHLNHSGSFSEDSNSGVEPPYERVRSKSEHSYETLGKKSMAKFDPETNSSQDTIYEAMTNDDKESVGYETVANPKEPGYETVTKVEELGYEVVKAKDPHYETVKDKIHGYDTVKESSDSGYEIVMDNTKPVHGYETLKPKLPPRDGNRKKIPDILQNLSDDKSELAVNKSKIIPAEVLALYAKIDKSKKKNAASNQNCHPPVCESHPTDYQRSSKLTAGAKELIRKYNSLTLDDDSSPSVSPPQSMTSDISSGSSTLRPLPPLPDNR